MQFELELEVALALAVITSDSECVDSQADSENLYVTLRVSHTNAKRGNVTQ